MYAEKTQRVGNDRPCYIATKLHSLGCCTSRSGLAALFSTLAATNIYSALAELTSVQAGAVLMPLAMFLLSLKSIRMLSKVSLSI